MRLAAPLVLLFLPLVGGCYASHLDGDDPPPRRRDCLELRDQGIVSSLRTDSEIWARPDASDFGCSGPFGFADIPREEFVFCNRGPDVLYEIALDGADADSSLGLRDPYLVVYEGAGVPDDPAACLAGNDDDGEGLGSRVTVLIPAGQTITAVATSFGSDFGTFQLRLRPAE